MSSGWFDCTEPYIFTWETRCAGCFVQALQTFSNLREPQHCRASKVCRVLSQEFSVVRVYRIFSNDFFTRGGGGGVQGGKALVQCSSSALNLLKPQHGRSSKVHRVLSQTFRVVQLNLLYLLLYMGSKVCRVLRSG